MDKGTLYPSCSGLFGSSFVRGPDFLQYYNQSNSLVGVYSAPSFRNLHGNHVVQRSGLFHCIFVLGTAVLMYRYIYIFEHDPSTRV